MDSAWEQEKLEARKILDAKRAAESLAFSARFVGRLFDLQKALHKKDGIIRIPFYIKTSVAVQHNDEHVSSVRYLSGQCWLSIKLVSCGDLFPFRHQHIFLRKYAQKAHSTRKQSDTKPTIEKRNHPVRDNMSQP